MLRICDGERALYAFFWGAWVPFLSLILTVTLCFAQTFEKDKPVVRIGFVTTLTGSAAAIGEDMQAGADLALLHLDGKMAGLPVQIFYKDDRFKPLIARQVTDELVLRENVDFVTGFIWSHTLLASASSVLKAGRFLISANAGPSQIAGAGCHEDFFSVSWQGDQTPMALGELMNAEGFGKVYMMAPNYTAGKDMVAGFERTFKGEIVGKDLTRWGPNPQLDFSAEFAKVEASGAEVLWAFYPGGSNIAFLSQYEQSGLAENVPLYSVFVLDALTLPRLRQAGLKTVLGSVFPQSWDPTLENSLNQRFVSEFREKYGRYPSFYAAQSYDAINLIHLAVVSVDGDMRKRDQMRLAMESANFPSVRGSLRFGRNHFPIQNFYLRKVVVDAEGEWTTRIEDVILRDHQDPYVESCKR